MRENASVSEIKSFTDDSSDVQMKVSPQVECDKNGVTRKLWDSFENKSQESNSVTEIKASGSKRFKGQLKNYLQTTRRRKTPFKVTNAMSKNAVPSPTSYCSGLDSGSSSAGWYNYRNLFGRNFLSEDYMQNYAVYGYGNGCSRNSYGYQSWDHEREKRQEEAYSGVLNGDQGQSSSFSYALPYGGNDYSSAYEAYSAAVAAAAVVAAASGQSQCSEYSTPNALSHTHETDAYDGSIRVIRSPLMYNTTSQDQQTYATHQHHPMHVIAQQHQALPPFSGYLQQKDSVDDDGDSDLVSKLCLKSEVGMRPTQPTWFSSINSLRQTVPGGMETETKPRSQSSQITSYQQHQQHHHLCSTTDTVARSNVG